MARAGPGRHDPGSAAGRALPGTARYGIPEAPSAHVSRPHVSTSLAGAVNLPLVLVSAPAGTGKTDAVAEWARAEPRGTVCWVSFEDGDVSFWEPVLEALRRHGLGVPTSWTVPTGRGLGSQRLNALAGLVVGASRRLTLVVDGYELASRAVAREVDHLLRHTPGRLCLVLVDRVDPVLPLYRYRLTDSVLEIRAPDLAFADDEAAQLLKSMGVELGVGAVHGLNRRLSGWAAGLRFAARALVGRDDAAAYVATVVEQTTDISEYLVAEVLDAQSPEVRHFLLDTCVTPEFSADLAALVGGAGAVRTMNGLVDHQAFVQPVPGHPGYFHYFPFFRSLLLAELAYESPQRLAEVRRIASRWFRTQGQYVESLAMLATVSAWQELATQLVDDGLVGRLLLEAPGGALAEVARCLPTAVDDPASSVVRAALALRQGEAGKERCARELASARRVLHRDGLDPPLMVAAAGTEALRACLTEGVAKAVAAVAEAERLLPGTPVAPARAGGSELETAVTFAAGIVALRRGDLAVARAGLSRAVVLAPSSVSAAFRADCLGHLAVADALQGELAAAVRHAEEALTIASQAGLGNLEVPPSAHVGLAWVGVERCDARLTLEHVTAARSSRTLPADPFCSGLVEAATAALEESTGRPGPALDRLEEAADVSAGSDPWVADHLRVEAAWLSVREGAPQHALDVLESVQLPRLPEVSVAAAAALAEQGFPRRVDGLPVRDGVASLGVQVRALLVEASQTAHDRSTGQAGPALSRALRLAATEHLRRPFRESSASRRLLSADPRLAQEHDWLHHVGARAGTAGSPESHAGLPIVVEPLTPKELEVLGHLAGLLTTDEIAQVMFVSVNTVRTHIRKILRKLGVNRRNAAIRRARELGLLED